MVGPTTPPPAPAPAPAPAAAPAPAPSTTNFPRIAAWALTGLTALYLMHSCSQGSSYRSQNVPAQIQQKMTPDERYKANIPGSYQFKKD